MKRWLRCVISDFPPSKPRVGRLLGSFCVRCWFAHLSAQRQRVVILSAHAVFSSIGFFFFSYRALHLLLLAWGFHEYCTVRSMVKLHVACSVSHYFMNYRWRLWQRNTSYSVRVSLEIHWSLFQAILSSDLVRYQYFPSFSLSFNLTVWNWKPSSFIYELMWGKNQTCS